MLSRLVARVLQVTPYKKILDPPTPGNTAGMDLTIAARLVYIRRCTDGVGRGSAGAAAARSSAARLLRAVAAQRHAASVVGHSQRRHLQRTARQPRQPPQRLQVHQRRSPEKEVGDA